MLICPFSLEKEMEKPWPLSLLFLGNVKMGSDLDRGILRRGLSRRCAEQGGIKQGQ